MKQETEVKESLLSIKRHNNSWGWEMARPEPVLLSSPLQGGGAMCPVLSNRIGAEAFEKLLYLPHRLFSAFCWLGGRGAEQPWKLCIEDGQNPSSS